VFNAVGFVNTEINSALVGLDCSDQKKIDQILIHLDGTDNKARMGANSLLAVSLAVAHANANCKRNPSIKLYLKIQIIHYLRP
jgi:enolase